MTTGTGSVTRAADLVSSLGVNTHIDFGGTYANLTQLESSINYLGIHNLRDCMGSSADLTSWLAVSNATGAKFDDYIGETSPAGMTAELSNVAAAAKAGVLNFVEGGNEEDDTYPAGLGNTVAITAAFQQQVFATAQSLGLPSINMSFGAGWTADNNWHGDYDKVGDLSKYCTYGNAHTYPNFPNGAPDGAIQQLNSDALLAASSRPVITTEIGWDEGQGFTQSDVAKYVLDASLDGMKDGNPKTYFYAMYDDGSGKFGLMNADGTAKPAATALHNLTTLLADTGANASSFTTGSLSYTLGGTTSSDFSLMLQKSDGSHWLALWNETETAGAPHTVTLSLGGAATQILVFDPLTGTSAIQSASNTATLAISLPDHPVLVEIVGGGGTATIPPVIVPPATATPSPLVVLPTAAPSMVMGVSGAVAGVSLTDAWAAISPGTLGLNLTADMGSFSIRNAAGTVLSATAGNQISLSDTLANLNADLATLHYTGRAVGTGHLTVDLWDQAGKESLKVLAVNVTKASVVTPPDGPLAPNPNVMLLAAAVQGDVGKKTTLGSVSLSDPWAKGHAGIVGLNVTADQGQLALHYVDYSSAVGIHISGSLDALNAELSAMRFIGATAGVAHVTIDFWDQAGVEGTKVLAVNLTAPATAAFAVMAPAHTV